jgi:hypothetical protein
MRYVLLTLGGIGLAAGGLLFKDNATLATLLVQLGGIFLASGMATADIVEAIKRAAHGR